MKMATKSIIMFFMTLVFAFPLFAQSETLPSVRAVANPSQYKPHVGIMAGASNPEGAFDADTEYGIEVGLQPVIPFSYAIELSHAEYEDTDSPFNPEATRTKLLFRGSYNFGGNIPLLNWSHIDLAAGPMYEDGADDDEIAFGLMPSVGFDIPIGNFTAGASARYLISSGSLEDTFTVAGVVKYWF